MLEIKKYGDFYDKTGKRLNFRGLPSDIKLEMNCTENGRRKIMGCEELTEELFNQINNEELTIHSLWNIIKSQEGVKTHRNAKLLRVIRSLNKLICTFRYLPDFKELTSQTPNKEYGKNKLLIRKNIGLPSLKPNVMYNEEQSIWGFLKTYSGYIAGPALCGWVMDYKDMGQKTMKEAFKGRSYVKGGKQKRRGK